MRSHRSQMMQQRVTLRFSVFQQSVPFIGISEVVSLKVLFQLAAKRRFSASLSVPRVQIIIAIMAETETIPNVSMSMESSLDLCE